MTDIVLKGNFLQQARGFKFADGGGVTWAFNAPTNTLSATAGGGAGTWGSITGTLSNQTDLWSVLKTARSYTFFLSR